MTSRAKTKRDMVEKKPRPRNADATKTRIREAAKAEFALLGLGGARVDVIAEKSGANKRMIYHYFGSKEELFQAVVEQAYLDIRDAERALDLEHLAPRDALETLVRFTWNYYLENPEFLTLVNSENLHRARHLEDSMRVRETGRGLVELVRGILQRGVEEGAFRPGIDPVQLNITIAAIGYYYLTNRYTGAILFDRDFVAEPALDDRLAFNIETVMRLVEA